MKDKDRNILVALVAVLVGGSICAVAAAVRWCSVCRASYYTLAGAAQASS